MRRRRRLELTREDLGPCCACGEIGPTVRNILMIEEKAPVPGTGWGCLQCGLPQDGAIAVFCDRCCGEQRPARWACKGAVSTKGRVPIGELAGEHKHRMEFHPEALAAFN